MCAQLTRRSRLPYSQLAACAGQAKPSISQIPCIAIRAPGGPSPITIRPSELPPDTKSTNDTPMKSRTTKRRIVETAVGAALGAAIAGPAGALAGGLAASKAASGVEHLGEGRRPRKRTAGRAKAPAIHARLKRILVPIDFSPPSLEAARLAGRWAGLFGAELCVLHVLEPLHVTAPFGGEPVVLPPRPAAFSREMKASLEKTARRECRGAARVSVHLREGVAYDEIVAAARKLQADIIIIATHGRSGLMRALMGSTAERVARHAACPVLVVPPGAGRGR